MTAQSIHPYALTIENAARYSGLSRSRIYELMAAGDLNWFKVGSRRMILTEVLKSYLDRVAAQTRNK